MLSIRDRERRKQDIQKRALQAFILNGFINQSMFQFAEACEVSIKCLYRYFDSKEALMREVIEMKIKEIVRELQSKTGSSSEVFQLADHYLLLISHNERFFRKLYSEIPFYNEEIREVCFSMEVIVRDLFYNRILEQCTHIPVADIPLVINPFYALIYFYLINKETFTNEKSIIKNRKNEILALLNKLLEKEKIMKEKKCQSCGMPMTEISHFGGKNVENDYCCYCTYEDGTLMSYEDKVNHTADFIRRSSGVDQDKAMEMAKNNLDKFDVWKPFLKK